MVHTSFKATISEIKQSFNVSILPLTRAPQILNISTCFSFYILICITRITNIKIQYETLIYQQSRSICTEVNI